MGLTLDMDRQYVYWIVIDSDDSVLYRSRMARYEDELPHKNIKYEKVYTLENTIVEGPLRYFNNRLLWLQENRVSVIGDLQGQYSAKLSGKNLLNLITVTIVDSSLQIWPGNFTKF